MLRKNEKDCFREFTSSSINTSTLHKKGQYGVIERKLYMTMRLPSEKGENVQKMIVNVRNFLNANIFWI